MLTPYQSKLRNTKRNIKRSTERTTKRDVKNQTGFNMKTVSRIVLIIMQTEY